VRAEPAGAEREVAAVDVSYANLLTASRDRLTEKRRGPLQRPPAVVKASENRDVMVAVVEQVATEQNQVALALRDQGRTDEAKELLVKNAQFAAENASSPRVEQAPGAGRRQPEGRRGDHRHGLERDPQADAREQSKTQKQRRW